MAQIHQVMTILKIQDGRHIWRWIKVHKIFVMQENMDKDTKITFSGHLEHILGGHIHPVAVILKMADNTLKATSLLSSDSELFKKYWHC